MSQVLIIIPAFNESPVVGDVVKQVRGLLPKATVLVVDDGSMDQTAEKARQAGAEVISHMINRGLGGAIGTGMAYARQGAFDFAVTIDADGQHDPRDILKVLKPLKDDDADVVIGSRMTSNVAEMPWERYMINRLANFVTLLFFGVVTSDSQSGFRGFNRKAIESIEIQTNRMEVSSEFFAEIRRKKLRYTEVPIRVIYTDYSRSKGQSGSNALSVFSKLVLRLFR